MTPLAASLAVRWFPALQQKVRDGLLILVGAWWIALFAQVRIPLPFTPIPITGQTFAVLLIGASLGARRGLASVMLYLGLGIGGLPVFAGGASGLAHLLGPSGGYLLGFLLAAYVIGWMAEQGLERSFRTSFFPFLIGTLLIYLSGASWLAFYVGPFAALEKGVLPFLVGDLIKLSLAALALPAAWKLVR
ncbi:MAG: biotin transporter BioY [Anaerolineales bacterium]